MHDGQPRPRIIAIANQKGGVGKTTTAITLAAALAELGRDVLIVDLDPQGNASTGLGNYAADRRHTSYDVLLNRLPLAETIIATNVTRLALCPASSDLSSMDMEMAADSQRLTRLRDAFLPLIASTDSPEFVLIDCPPSLNLLTLNALIAAHSVLIPLQTEYFALEGLSQLMLTIREVRQAANPGLRIEGVLLTMYDRRNNLTVQVEEDARQTLGDLVFKTVIPRNIRLSEAPSHALPVTVYDPPSRGSEAYRALAAEILGQLPANASEGRST